MRKKALIAFAFASGILNSQLPALAEPKAESDSMVERIANYTQIAPAQRAFYLLNIADSLIAGTKRSQLEEQYKPMFSGKTDYWHRLNKNWESGLASWAERISAEGRSSKNAQTGAKSQSANPENLALADEAIKRALTELDKETEPFAKLHLCFIASRLCKKVGNADGVQKCNKVINQALRSCEGSSQADEAQIKAATSVLNAEAFGFIPIVISDFGAKGAPLPKQEPQQAMPFKEADFKEAEKLRLRAVAMADTLSAQSHVRRKAHRDLTLWYMRLGKMEQANKQKQLLFNLVGFKDDSVLYPQQEGCGNLVWWRQEKNTAVYKCGMG